MPATPGRGAAIERIGCTLDGVLRADRPAADGAVRDSAVFSMLAEEWPAARAALVARLTRLTAGH